MVVVAFDVAGAVAIAIAIAIAIAVAVAVVAAIDPELCCCCCCCRRRQLSALLIDRSIRGINGSVSPLLVVLKNSEREAINFIDVVVKDFTIENPDQK